MSINYFDLKEGDFVEYVVSFIDNEKEYFYILTDIDIDAYSDNIDDIKRQIDLNKYNI